MTGTSSRAFPPSRRLVLGGALGLAACNRRADAQAWPAEVPPLKHVAPFPVGSCVQAGQLDDPDWVVLARTHVSQLTPEWEMKMEYIVQDDGSLRFDRPDRIAAFARENGMRLFGHALVWYAQKPEGFLRLDESRVSFGKAYDNYIAAVVGRYRGASGWDVVNEAVAEDGDGWRDSLWASRLGDLDHMVRAFRAAKAADPDAVLFINDYNLETIPRKLETYMRLIDRLLAAGAPLDGIGCQTHVDAGLAEGALERTLNALARFGLPIHLSELDVSLVRARRPLAGRSALEAAQARVYAEAAAAFAALPRSQRFAFTLWGLRDGDSWLVRENASDRPVPFDNTGAAKPAAAALARALAGGG
ncbi:MAG: endo-1,4-beta-xylanase [Phenylobacterium sp.]|uniref:endo-1,4-beta-xylanase n=1 Tax=Phenylobacterium sp. TaxID=1871053 RepID=UPI00391A17DA